MKNEELAAEAQNFSERLSHLRTNKGISARDMSLSIGQSAGYINNVENGVNLPSMTVFFYICDYLNISPADFFDNKKTNPIKLKELEEICSTLSAEKLNLLIQIAKAFK